ncbi:hypothetical protein [Bradyrhizobium sp. SZCCHNS3053]|uniref:hypothetical protein n=1 Tax=Bradyrhizobium sp. SZCCHNS3053 TaxID=3057322 RepID=UPI002916239F|nr:hypothetical protein [Bradyrhizobium sp. SZCCHNS3053]
MRPNNRIAVPDVIDRFRSYKLSHPTWGALHTVLDDGNVRNKHVLDCAEFALETNDHEAFELAGLLLQMSTTQRQKLRNI